MRLVCAAVFSALFFTGCTSLLPFAGGTTDTGNSFTCGTVCRQNGTRAEGVPVTLHKSDYADTARTQPAARERVAITDSTGQFCFHSLDTGFYTLEINDRTGGTAALAKVAITADTGEFPLGIQVLRPYSIVSGILPARDFKPGVTFIQVYGTERCVPVLDKGTFTIADLPAGAYRFRIYYSDSPAQSFTGDSVQTVSGETTTVPFISWHCSKQVFLATTASGAAVGGTVSGFPVCIRLTQGNFNFSEAMADGSDLRFAKTDGTVLPYEIELWNSALAQAILWVCVDTVYGNNETQHFTMHWGNRNAVSLSNAAAVFDTLRGFQGVWHFGEAGTGPALDATANRYDGTPFNMTASSSVHGALGPCRRFSGDSTWYVMRNTAQSRLNFPPAGSYAVSAWVMADTFDNAKHSIVSKGDNQYNLEILDSNKWEFSEFKDRVGWETTRSIATAKTWVHLTGVRHGSRQYLYVNGVCADSAIITLDGGGSPRDESIDVMIGRIKVPSNAYTLFFKGNIDEVRMMNVAPGADWVKLCYMNQKSYDALVVFK